MKKSKERLHPLTASVVLGLPERVLEVDKDGLVDIDRAEELDPYLTSRELVEWTAAQGRPLALRTVQGYCQTAIMRLNLNSGRRLFKLSRFIAWIDSRKNVGRRVIGMSNRQRREAIKLANDGKSVREIASRFGVGKSEVGAFLQKARKQR